MKRAIEPSKTKKSITKGYKKSPIINYRRFYAIKFSIELGQQTPRAIRNFFNISDTTYYRIQRMKDFPAYVASNNADKQLRNNEKRLPQRLSDISIHKTKIITKQSDQSINNTLDKTKQILELSETILDQAHLALKTNQITQPKRGLFGRHK